MPTTTKERRFNFTEATVESLPYAQPGQRLVYYDTTIKNLVLRVSSSNKIYYLLKKVGNRTIFHKIGDANNTSLKNARKRMAELIEQTNRGENPNDAKRKIRDSITVQEFFDQYYFPDYSVMRKKAESQKMDKISMRLYVPDTIKRATMLTLTRADMERMHNEIWRRTKSVYSANRGLKLMRQMFNKAIDWGFPCTNPAARIKLFPENKRDRFLQPDELSVFFQEVAKIPNAASRNFILLSLFMGQRRRNIQALQWSDINFERRVAYIKTTKNGEPQIVPLSTQAIDLLHEMETFKTSTWLFPSKQSRSGHLENPQVAWRTMKERAGLTDLRLHDLRRTFASYQAITGSSNEIIGKALGDKSPAVIPIYARLTEDPVRQSIQRAADQMVAAAKITPPNTGVAQ
ncbi:MAG: site-specific integrase [Alphaproteobacteria bacterium]|nr:site-specific integrase [Alphaproteobacteria bacterium]